MKNTIDSFENGVREAFLPPVRMLPSEWAENYRFVPEGSSAFAGRFSYETTPEFRFFCDSYANPKVRRLVGMIASQTGKSAAMENMIGSNIQNRPGPMLLVLPTLKNAEDFLAERIVKMIAATPSINSLVQVTERKKGNDIGRLMFPGGFLVAVGTKKSSDLASRPCRDIFSDEVDRMDDDVENEGDPLDLAYRRSDTFFDRKIVMISTPTDEVTSKIYREFKSGSQHRFYAECPYCSHRQVMRFDRLRWDKSLPLQDRPDSARYHCEGADCGAEWDESDRLSAIKNGACNHPDGGWIADNPEQTEVMSFHMSRLSASIGRMSSIVSDFIKIGNRQTKLKTFINTVLAEVWKGNQGNSLTPTDLIDRRESYATNALPAGAFLVTCGIDVQIDRLEAVTVAWGDLEESWVLEYKVFYGDPNGVDVWLKIENYICDTKFYATEGEGFAKIRRVAVDSGNNTRRVYDWVYENNEFRSRYRGVIIPTKGSSVSAHPMYKISKTGVGTVGNPLAIIGTFEGKSTLLSRAAIKSGNSGRIHFHEGLTEIFFNQFLSNRLRTKFDKGYAKYEYIKDSNQCDEVLDCMVLNLFLYEFMPVNPAIEKSFIEINAGGREATIPTIQY